MVHPLGGSETREQAQKPAHKDLEAKWPKPSQGHLCSGF